MRLPTPARLGLLLWMTTLCVVSQIPYQLVWQGLSTFPYDAFTTFNPWFVGQLAELRGGEGILALYQDEVPFDVWPSYVFTGIVRQLFAVVQANTAIGHALVQASHVVLMVPAIALLCRSLGVPWRYGVVGGLVFTLTGIHVSLAHHVLAHEALLYLALSLFCVRSTLLGWQGFGAMQRVWMFAMTGIVTCSLVRVHHEAMLYLIPLAAWALAHLIVLHRVSGGSAMARAAGVMGGLGMLVAIASVPMLVTAYELSLVNKTAIDSYDQLGPYFSDPRAFFASLVMPGFSGGNSVAMPVAFGFGQEATLSYVFFGTLTMPFLAVVLATWWREGRRAPAGVLAATVVVVVGYAIGAGSPIHRMLCIVFPFLVKIGHNYYGLHLLYLLGAFVVADGLRIVIEQRRYPLLFIVAGIQLVMSAVLFHQARENMGWGPQGSLPAFVATVMGDLRWQGWLVGVLALLAFIVAVRIRGNTLIGHASARVGTARIEWLTLLALAAIISSDLIRPIRTAHFLPNRQWVEWGTSPLGGFNPSLEVRRFLNSQQRTLERPLRVVPIFPKGGGWQGNALMATDMHLVGMPGDSGGNRHVEAWLSKEPDAGRLLEFIDRFGVDAVWVSRWGVDEWAAAIAATPLLKVYSSAYGGDVYMRSSPLSQKAVVRGDALHLPWGGGGQSVIEQGLVTRTWRFSLSTPQSESVAPKQINLPLMWHAGYGIALDGISIQGESSVDGTLAVTVPPGSLGSQELVVRYPNQSIAALMVLAAMVYGGLLVLLGWSTLRLLRKPRPVLTAPLPVVQPAFRRVP